MTCDCISYNRPDLGGKNAPRLLRPPSWSVKPLVEVDDCIAEAVMAIWNAGIITLGSCCGHNGKLGKPSVIVHQEQVKAAVAILSAERNLEAEWAPRGWEVLAWEGNVLVAHPVAEGMVSRELAQDWGPFAAMTKAWIEREVAKQLGESTQNSGGKQ